VIQSENVKQLISPVQVLSLYNVKRSSAGLYKCCFHDDKTPSMKAFDEYVYCHGCGAKGSVIDLYMQLSGSNFCDSCNELGSLFGLSSDKKSIASANRLRDERRKQQEIESSKKARKVEAFCLLCDLEKEYEKQIEMAAKRRDEDTIVWMSRRLCSIHMKLDYLLGLDKLIPKKKKRRRLNAL
jgi:DNA primase